MIVKLTNKDESFYQHMGKFFGSRLIQKETSDRIYDDNDKSWYIYLKDDISLGFISVSKNTIKNIFAVKTDYIIELLNTVQQDIPLSPSVVPNLYSDIYKECGFNVNNTSYKNFVVISNFSERTDATL